VRIVRIVAHLFVQHFGGLHTTKCVGFPENGSITGISQD
jgi:hypothetical protein